MTDTTLQTLSIMRCWKAKNVLDQYAFPCLKQYTVEKMATGVAWKMHIYPNATHTHAAGVHTGRHRSHALIFYVNCRHAHFRHRSCDFPGGVFAIGTAPGSQVSGRGCPALSGHSQHCLGLTPTTAGTPASQVKIPHHVLDEPGSGTYRRVLGEGD